MRTFFLFLGLFLSLSFMTHSSFSNSEAKLVARDFFDAFQRHDILRMKELYVSDQSDVFSDPIFKNLNSKQTKSMWEMLIESSEDLSVEYQINSGTGNEVRASWQAKYTFPYSGRVVRNKVNSVLTIQDEKIVKHFGPYAGYSQQFLFKMERENYQKKWL